MLVFGTQMHIVTFIFVSIELVIFFYLLVYRMARPDDRNISLNIILIFLLITYNVTGGLLPDPNLPGSYFFQEVIAYGTGFITPSYFPYYVYKAFSLTQMKFHALKGILLFLVFPYLIFILSFAVTHSLQFAQKLLILPVFYAIWVIFSLYRAIRYKYRGKFNKKEEKRELFVLLVSLTPWIGLPVITYFDWGQATEASITNIGFLLLFGLQVSRNVAQIRKEHERLIESEQELLNWNGNLQSEVERRTNELAMVNEQRVNNFINLVHETKTPLTLIRNYFDEYINKHGSDKELEVIRGGIDKLTGDIINMFDIERFIKGVEVYRHNMVSDFSMNLKNSFPLFEYYCKNQRITCLMNIEDNLCVQADPNAINRVINNIIENAIKFTNPGGRIEISLASIKENVVFSVADTGIGIHPSLHSRIFEPYYQINNKTTSLQGMGLGLPIVKRVVDSLRGDIKVESSIIEPKGTKFTVLLKQHVREDSIPSSNTINEIVITSMDKFMDYGVPEIPYSTNKSTLLVIEDNKAMLHFLSTRLMEKYNVYFAANGVEALKKLYAMPVKPHLILSDLMMDKMDGFAFLKSLSEQHGFNHIPVIFLSARTTPADRIKGLKLGAVDYISKPFALGELRQKIEAILGIIDRQHKAILNASIEKFSLMNKVESSGLGSLRFEQNCRLFRLTARETEVVQLMISGKTYRDIGSELYISERTVTKHVQNIFEKTAASNKISLFNKLNK